jgi:hypothetical protein
MPDPVHYLLGPHGDWKQAHVACGAQYYSAASWRPDDVTCPACLRGIRRAQTAMSEAQLQELVRSLAAQHGWMYFHVYDSRKSPPGWPDCVLLRGEYGIIAELKSATGVLSEPQKAWLAALRQIKNITCHVWRPNDLPAITALLGQQVRTPRVYPDDWPQIVEEISR